jgi:acyl-CoA dehydrogenase
MRTPGASRDRLTDGIYLPDDPEEPLARLEEALRLAEETRALRRRLRRDPVPPPTPEEQDLLERFERLRREVLAVDELPAGGEPEKAPAGVEAAATSRPGAG